MLDGLTCHASLKTTRQLQPRTPVAVENHPAKKELLQIPTRATAAAAATRIARVMGAHAGVVLPGGGFYSGRVS
jgi:hypothetical protein